MDCHGNTFALLVDDDEDDLAAIIKKVAAAQANPPPELEKPKPSDEPARRGERRLAPKPSDESGKGFGPNGINGNRVSNRSNFNGQSRGRGGGRGERGQGFYEDSRFRNKDNYVSNGEGEGFKGNFTERRQYSGENRVVGPEDRRYYGGRGRGGYFGFRGGEGQRLNGGRNGTEDGLNRQGGNDGGNAGTGWEKPKTTQVAKVAEVHKESAVKEISEDLNQKKDASENKEEAQKNTEERRERRKKEWDEDAEKMTLAEYWKVLEEKRRALEANKVGERKVLVDEELERMQLVEKKKMKEEEFIKGSEKEKIKKKDSLGKEDKIRKTLSIDEFLKPCEGQRYGRGRGSFRDSSTDGEAHSASAVRRDDSLEVDDRTQFPQLGEAGKIAKAKAVRGVRIQWGRPH